MATRQAPAIAPYLSAGLRGFGGSAWVNIFTAADGGGGDEDFSAGAAPWVPFAAGAGVVSPTGFVAGSGGQTGMGGKSGLAAGWAIEICGLALSGACDPVETATGVVDSFWGDTAAGAGAFAGAVSVAGLFAAGVGVALVAGADAAGAAAIESGLTIRSAGAAVAAGGGGGGADSFAGGGGGGGDAGGGGGGGNPLAGSEGGGGGGVDMGGGRGDERG
jgi:hypothetical protein